MSKFSEVLSSKTFLIVVSFIGLYLISAGVSFAAFTYLSDSPNSSVSLEGLAKKRAEIAELPKTEECPINGQYYSEPEREIWEKRRPAAVIIQNHIEARPLSGLSKADVVYEAVAESGVTRFLGIFYCGVASEDLRIAVVRSARVYFINWAAEYGKNPIFLHWGGANNFCVTCPGGVKPRGQIAPEVNAFALLDELGWRNGQSGNDMDGGTNVGVPVVMRDKNRLSSDADYKIAAEHTPAAFSDALFDEAAERGFSYVDAEGDEWTVGYEPWEFVDEDPSTSPSATNIAYDFWNDTVYNVEWVYDKDSNSYKRINGGEPFVDWEFDSEQVTSKNVVIQFVDERTGVDREGHVFYKVVDTGPALVFSNGNVIEGTWEKESLTDRTRFYDEDGKEISFVRGTIWISAVPTGNEVDF